MRKLLLIAGVAALAIPFAAWSQAGHYSPSGHWVADPSAASEAARDTDYTGPADDLSAREAWIEARIHRGDASGALSHGDSKRDFDELGGIRQFEAKQADRHHGLSGTDRADVLNKLDNLTADVRKQWNEKD